MQAEDEETLLSMEHCSQMIMEEESIVDIFGAVTIFVESRSRCSSQAKLGAVAEEMRKEGGLGTDEERSQRNRQGREAWFKEYPYSYTHRQLGSEMSEWRSSSLSAISI